MYKLFVPSPESHWRRTLATISGPLSDLMKAGSHSKSMASASVSMTPIALIRRATRIARYLRLNSSIKVISRIRRPSWVAASTKSRLQTWLGYSGRSRMKDSSLSRRNIGSAISVVLSLARTFGSLRNILQDLLLERKISHQLLEPTVFKLQLLQLPACSTFRPPYSLRYRWQRCSVRPVSLQATATLLPWLCGAQLATAS
jgi:hypothetical protein